LSAYPWKIALGLCVGKERTERTRRLARLCRPIEAVLQAFRAAELLRVFEDAITVAIFRGVIALSIDKGQRGFDGVCFVAADAAAEDFVRARSRRRRTIPRRGGPPVSEAANRSVRPRAFSSPR
jgi:hypothetical protein